jgi:SecD/SecF fusion protein
VPAYAVASAGAPVDVEPADRRAPTPALTAPHDPTQVSRQDFDDMVRNLGIDEPARKPAAAAAGRPAGGRRARARASGGDGSAGRAGKPPAEGGGSPPQGPSDKPKKPRNRRHGRPR